MMFTFLAASVLQAGTLASQSAARQVTVPITGTALNSTFAGVFTPLRFANQDGALALVGRLTGTLTNTVTGVVTQVNRLITLPVTIGQATCEILDLQLGPLDLDLLGLMVHLDQVNLNITAQSGPGNLLGNLLCAVAGLLDGGGPLGGLVGLLNNILRNL